MSNLDKNIDDIEYKILKINDLLFKAVLTDIDKNLKQEVDNIITMSQESLEKVKDLCEKYELEEKEEQKNEILNHLQKIEDNVNAILNKNKKSQNNININYPEPTEEYAIYIHNNSESTVDSVKLILDVVLALNNKTMNAVLKEAEKNGKAWIMQGTEQELEELKFTHKMLEKIVDTHKNEKNNFGPLKFTLEEVKPKAKAKINKKL